MSADKHPPSQDWFDREFIRRDEHAAEGEALRAVLAEAREALEKGMAALPGPGGLWGPEGSLRQLSLSASDGGDLCDTDFAAYQCLRDLIEAAHTARARIAALDVPAQQEDCPHCSKRVSACSCEDPTTTYVAETPEAEPEWVRIENEARARDGRPLHPGPIPRSAYKNNPYAYD
jgi:hypothetical protein